MYYSPVTVGSLSASGIVNVQWHDGGHHTEIVKAVHCPSVIIPQRSTQGMDSSTLSGLATRMATSTVHSNSTGYPLQQEYHRLASTLHLCRWNNSSHRLASSTLHLCRWNLICLVYYWSPGWFELHIQACSRRRYTGNRLCRSICPAPDLFDCGSC